MQVDAVDFVRTGQIVYVEDETGSSWPFGVHNALNHEFVVCQALGRKSTPMRVEESRLVTLVVPVENGARLLTSELVESDSERSRITLRPTGEVQQVQRRQYFRIQKPSVIAHYQIVEATPTEDNIMPIETMVWDLSGNGIGLVVRSAKPIYTGCCIKVVIALPDDAPIDLLGEVTRVVPRSIIKSEYLLGVNFKKIRESDRDKIVRFVMQEQLVSQKVKRR